MPKDNMLFDAVGVGALNCDMLFEVMPEQLESINRELDNPFVLGKEDTGKPEEFETTLQAVEKHAKPLGQDLGGSAANTVTALSRMGLKTGYLGMVGYDGFNQFLQGMLRLENVDNSRVFIGRLGSGVCISISDGEDRALRVFPNSNDLLGLRNLYAYSRDLSDYLGISEVVHMSSFVCSLGEEPLDVQRKIAEQLGQKVMISFAPGELYARLGLKALQPILQNSHVLFLNRREMQILTDEDYREGSRKLLGLGPHYVVCTLGRDGSYLRNRDDEIYADQERIPESELRIEGITGAGDYFAAGFLAGVLRQQSPEYCMSLGNKVASMKLRGTERKPYQNIEL